MDSPEKIPLSDEQTQQLQQEEYISRILRVRSEQDQPSKSPWLKFLGTAGGAALITVLIGGLLGTVLNFFIQSGLKSREIEQARQRSKGEIAIISFRDHLDRRQETTKNLYSLIGRCASASHSLLARTNFDTTKYPTTKEKLVEESEQIHKDFQKTQAEWLSNRDSLGLLVSYYFEGDASVTNCWHQTEDSVTQYLECADAEYNAYTNDWVQREVEPCQDKRSNFQKTIGEFTQCVERANFYPWKEYYPEYSSQPSNASSPTRQGR
jgi:hypothetical protein